jgi:hypothetical protein
MGWDLNRQAKAFLICLSTPWLLALLAALLIGVLVPLAWLGFLIWPLKGPAE